VARDAARKIAGGVARRSGGCRARRDMTVPLPSARWKELGVRLPSGKALPASTPEASLVSGATRHFLVYSNYDALLEYNCANSYAISVALLGNAVMSGDPPATPPKRAPKKRK
jgi:membrane-bound lytic murein transglycosylase B